MVDDHHDVQISVGSYREKITLDNITFYPVDNLMVLFKEYGSYRVTKQEVIYVPWHAISSTLFEIYLVLSILAMLQRDDFANITVAGAANFHFEYARMID